MTQGSPEPGNAAQMPPEPARAGVLRFMLRPHVAKGAVRVSLVVGTVLNLINNGEQLWVHQTVNLWRVALNFAVPFLVSAYSAARNEAQRAKGG